MDIERRSEWGGKVVVLKKGGCSGNSRVAVAVPLKRRVLEHRPEIGFVRPILGELHLGPLSDPWVRQGWATPIHMPGHNRIPMPD